MTRHAPGHTCLLAGTVGVLFIISFAYGFQFHIGAEGKAFYFRSWSVVFVACLGLVSWGIMRIQHHGESYTPPDWLAPALTTLSFLTTLYFWLPTRVAAIAGAIVVAMALALMRSRRHGPCLLALLVTHMFLAVFLISDRPLSTMGADMLPNIAIANMRLLSGQDPYEQVYDNDFFYLPVQWLIYLPFVVTGLDLRIGNFICIVAFIAYLGTAVRDKKIRSIAFVLLGPILVSRSSMDMILAGQVWPYWILTLGLFESLRSRSAMMCAILLGLLMATQQPALLFVILVGVYLVVQGRPGKAILIGLGTGLVYILIMTPWIIWRPSVLFELYVDVQRILTEKHIVDPKWDWSEVSLLNLLQALGLGSWRSGGQFVVLFGATIAIVVTRHLRLGMFLCLCGAAYLFAISLNVQVFKYYYYPGLILIALGAALPPQVLAPFGTREAVPPAEDPIR